MQQGAPLPDASVRPNLPPALRLGIAISILRSAVTLIVHMTDAYGGWLVAIREIGQLAETTLCAFGALELARGHSGAARRGLQIASAGWFGELALFALWWVTRALPGLTSETSPPNLHNAWVVLGAAQVIGLAIAAAARGYRGLAIAGVVLSLATRVFPMTWSTFDDTTISLLVVFGLLRIAILGGLATMLAGSPASPDPAVSARGLRRAGGALTCVALAICGKTLLLIVGLYQATSESFAWFRLAFLAAAAVLIAAIAWVVVGVLDTSRGAPAGRPRSRLVIASALMLGGLEGMMGSWLEIRGADIFHVLPLLPSVLLTAGLVCLISEIGRVARESPASPEDRSVLARTIFVILLMAAGAVPGTWILWIAESNESAAVLLCLTGFSTAAALMIAARMCRASANLVPGAHAELPAARVVG